MAKLSKRAAIVAATSAHSVTMREHMRMARYWASDARRCLAVGDDRGAAVSLEIMTTDRRAASDHRALRAKLAT